MDRRCAGIVLLVAACPFTAGCMDQVVADAGPNHTVEAGETVTLDGSKSRPRDRSAFSWEVIEGPTVTLDDASAAVTTFTAPSQTTDATVVAQLTVTYVDLAGQPYPPNSDMDWVRIRVHADPDAADVTDQTPTDDEVPPE